MKTLDLLIAKFKEFKEELSKNDTEMKKGLFGSKPTKPVNKPFTPSFKGHKAALGVGSTTNSNGITTETGFDANKQTTVKKKYIDVGLDKVECKSQPIAPKDFKKTINTSYSSPPNDMAMSTEKMTTDKNGQWSLAKDGEEV